MERITADHLLANGVTVQRWIPVTERLPSEKKVIDGEEYTKNVVVRIREIAFEKIAFYDDEVKCWFDGNYKLLNETSILFRENGTTQKRIPDRVMINGSKATVVDFKFGKEHEAYLHQVEEYISLLQQMGFTDVEGYIWYVYNNKTIKC
jgi:hypothetical protein